MVFYHESSFLLVIDSVHKSLILLVQVIAEFEVLLTGLEKVDPDVDRGSPCERHLTNFCPILSTIHILEGAMQCSRRHFALVEHVSDEGGLDNTQRPGRFTLLQRCLFINFLAADLRGQVITVDLGVGLDFLRLIVESGCLTSMEQTHRLSGVALRQHLLDEDLGLGSAHDRRKSLKFIGVVIFGGSRVDVTVY